MNTNELRCVATRDGKIKEKFIDVFALDQFKQFVKENTLIDGLYVCNDQISEKAGNHWFLIYSNQNDIYFVDSFAKPVKFYNLETF